MDTISQPKRRKVVRSVKKHKLLVRDHDGRLREILPTDTLWYQLYVSQPPSSSRHAKLFRQRFRLPYQSFLELSSQLFNHDMFIQWRSPDAVGNPPVTLNYYFLAPLGILDEHGLLTTYPRLMAFQFILILHFLTCLLTTVVQFYIKSMSFNHLLTMELRIKRRYLHQLVLMGVLDPQMQRMFQCSNVLIGRIIIIKVLN